MRRLRLATVGAVSALIGVICFLAGVVLMVSAGVDTLIPETGVQGLSWITDVQDAGGSFFVGAWLGIIGGLLLLIALVGFYDALREAGTVLIIAPITAAVGTTSSRVRTRPRLLAPFEESSPGRRSSQPPDRPTGSSPTGSVGIAAVPSQVHPTAAGGPPS
ncbi:MAG TPA: hypothetical protein VMQ46_10110 [Acidimicrobiia bacterium]|nr:hypothetical protein [Acidimicrobiia bacterium]